MDLIIIYVAYVLSRFASGNEDGKVSLTEIALASSRNRSSLPKWQIAEAKAVDKLRRESWHKDGAIKLVLIAISFSGFMYPDFLSMVAMFFSILSLQVVIFNPIIAVRYLDKHYTYISDSGWEGWWKHHIGERIYHFLFGWLIFAACLSFLILKRINIL